MKEPNQSPTLIRDIRVAQFTRLLDGFAQINRHRQNQEAVENTRRLVQFPVLVAGFRNQIEVWQKSQESTAEDFNLFDVLAVTGDEVRHSQLLAWLLDRQNERGGTHAQGSLGFRLFLKEVNLPLFYADARYWVRREQSGDESRVDLEIAARGEFVIHIENKVYAVEGPDQTKREWADLLKRAKSLEIPSGAVHGFFLTLDGISAENPRFLSLSWRIIARVFEEFAKEAKPPEVQLFASHCARALRKSCAETSREERSSEYDEESVQ